MGDRGRTRRRGLKKPVETDSMLDDVFDDQYQNITNDKKVCMSS